MNEQLIIACAQTVPNGTDVEQHLTDHIRLAEKAANLGASVILFPELSLTGYELAHAQDLAFGPTDPRLLPLQTVARERDIIIIAGAPLQVADALYIASFIVLPEQNPIYYTKHYVHSTEVGVFTCGNVNPLVPLGSERLGLAICADITNPAHPKEANRIGSTIYLSSVFISHKGYGPDTQMLEGYARQYEMPVFMSNFGGPSSEIDSAGQSAMWSETGELLGKLAVRGEGLLLGIKEDGHWRAEEII